MSIYTPEAIAARHRERLATLIAAHGGDKHAVPKADYHTASERLRAEHVIAIAQRDGLNVAKTLRHYFISEHLVHELGFEVAPTIEPLRGSKAIDHYIATHIDEYITVPGLADACDCSEQTARNYIKTHRSSFRLMDRGTYLIIDQRQARKEASK